MTKILRCTNLGTGSRFPAGWSLLFVLWALLAAVPAAAVAAAELTQAARSEISHLLDFIERSGCEFYRNGTWYDDATAAREHVERKYDYFRKRSRIDSAEDFITWAGTKSEISGEAYAVRCGKAPPVPMSKWLKEELERYRKKRE